MTTPSVWDYAWSYLKYAIFSAACLFLFASFVWYIQEVNALLDRAAQLEIRLTVAEARLVALESGRIDVPIPRTFAREVTP
jgi:hypothetical protein